MTRRKRDTLLALVQSYFRDYLQGIRGASAHTIRAYRDALKLFFVFLANRLRRPIAKLSLDDIRVDVVLGFLEHIESHRSNATVTRNSRLAAIRSFAQHLLRNDPTRAEQYAQIIAIPAKRCGHRPATYLEPEEARAIVAAPNTKSNNGTRDRALLLFLYNTGARVSEALAVRPRDIRLNRPQQVRLHGKGGKERVCPIWPETAKALRRLVSGVPDDEALFRNSQGAPLTRDGVAYLVNKYVRQVAERTPSLRKRRVTPHVFRHSCAVALLQAGVELTVIRDYLGHASVETTNRYVATNLRMKRDVLDAFWKRAGLEKGRNPQYCSSPKLLSFLESL